MRRPADPAKIRDQLIRYPALDAESFERRVHRFLETDDD